MRVLIIGGTGMLGHKLVQSLKSESEVFSTIRGNFGDVEKYGIFSRDRVFEQTDVHDVDRITSIIGQVKPDVVVNAVGVVKQLPSSKDAVQTILINSVFPHRLAEITARTGARLISVSTDCVFSGKKGFYGESDPPDAADLYGRSKLLGEVTEPNCLTLRTSIIGRELATGHSLIEWFIGENGGSVTGFTNAIYSGFPTITLSRIIGDVIRSHPQLSGLYHLSSDPVSKYDLLCLVKKHLNLEIDIRPDGDFKCDRSLDSGRFSEATGFRPPGWEDLIGELASDAQRYDDWRN